MVAPSRICIITKDYAVNDVAVKANFEGLGCHRSADRLVYKTQALSVSKDSETLYLEAEIVCYIFESTSIRNCQTLRSFPT